MAIGQVGHCWECGKKVENTQGVFCNACKKKHKEDPNYNPMSGKYFSKFKVM